MKTEIYWPTMQADFRIFPSPRGIKLPNPQLMNLSMSIPYHMFLDINNTYGITQIIFSTVNYRQQMIGIWSVLRAACTV